MPEQEKTGSPTPHNNCICRSLKNLTAALGVTVFAIAVCAGVRRWSCAQKGDFEAAIVVGPLCVLGLLSLFFLLPVSKAISGIAVVGHRL